jgi:signal transduction histidine kinase
MPSIGPWWGRSRAAAAIASYRRRVPDLAVDIVLAVVVSGLLLAGLPDVGGPRRAPTAVAVGLMLVMGGAIATRRSFPLTSYVVNGVALCIESIYIGRDGFAPYANLLLLYSAGLYATRRRALVAPLVTVPSVAVYFADGQSPAAMPVAIMFLWLVTWAAGYATARRREQQEQARSSMRHQATADERSRIARELHDLVGHTVNVMVVQAGAARLALDRDPAITRDLLAGIEQTGRDALGELDRVLGVLRPSTSDGAVAAPEPGLAELPRLAQRLAQAGIAVTVDIDEAVAPVPRSLELSLYRIVQEALTNALKHGLAATARVTVRRDGPTITVEVHDTGQGVPQGFQPGRGLLGIAERVSVFGGSVRYGGGDGGGFWLRAVLPAG